MKIQDAQIDLKKIDTAAANDFFKEVIALAAEHKVGIDNVIRGLEVLELRRQNDISMYHFDMQNK